MLDKFSESAESQLQADPAPCRRPLLKLTEKHSEIDHFSDLEKETHQNHESGYNGGSPGSMGAPF